MNPANMRMKTADRIVNIRRRKLMFFVFTRSCSISSSTMNVRRNPNVIRAVFAVLVI